MIGFIQHSAFEDLALFTCLAVALCCFACGAAFADDLGADSLALIELVEALEEELSERSVGFRIDDDDLEDLRTVRDAVDYVVSRFN